MCTQNEGATGSSGTGESMKERKKKMPPAEKEMPPAEQEMMPPPPQKSIPLPSPPLSSSLSPPLLSCSSSNISSKKDFQPFDVPVSKINQQTRNVGWMSTKKANFTTEVMTSSIVPIHRRSGVNDIAVNDIAVATAATFDNNSGNSNGNQPRKPFPSPSSCRSSSGPDTQGNAANSNSLVNASSRSKNVNNDSSNSIGVAEDCEESQCFENTEETG